VSKKLITYGHKVPHGKSIRETIWDELDDVMDLMMESGQPEWEQLPDGREDPDRIARVYQQYGKWQGIAEGICFVIALFEQPEHPDINSVKGTAVLRWEERQKESIPEDRTFDDEVQTSDPEPSSDLGSVEGEPDPDQGPRAGQASEAR
jgi:hypothetical protein